MRSARGIERHGTSSVMTQWTVCAVAMKVTDTAYNGIAALLSHTRRKARATKGAAPRSEQTTTREPDWGNLARYDERKVGLDEIVRGA